MAPSTKIFFFPFSRSQSFPQLDHPVPSCSPPHPLKMEVSVHLVLQPFSPK
ncbi:hypothetical protein I79_010411 [Cricetulus griseus]|uniref:Uncharacterized protein n=1 Tax=Cricetulus griseus TaxID=10029 RepID=G3HIF0_CRIGR|nr:hypothetical protein I79_010411 [Cricetulus griseus]